MAFVHGKDASVMIDADDISAYCNSFAPKRSADTHDTTTFGQQAHTYVGGLKDGTFDLEGMYDSDATAGPKDAIEGKLGETVQLTYRPEGVGTGKPEQTASAVVQSYEETTPVADMITWKATLQISGEVTTSDQTA